jgi:hypothetical protein
LKLRFESVKYGDLVSPLHKETLLIKTILDKDIAFILPLDKVIDWIEILFNDGIPELDYE